MLALFRPMLLTSMFRLALSYPGDLSNPIGNASLSARAAEPDDCAHAAYANIANVDCYYDYVQSKGKFLNYVIQIEPTGQGSVGWCDGIMTNLKTECGGYASNIDYEHCNPDYKTQVLEFPNNEKASGIDLNIHWKWQWETRDDETACITTAIRKATCAGLVTFKGDAGGKCRKRAVV